MVTALGSCDLEPYFAIIFCLIMKYWVQFDDQSKRIAMKLTTALFERHSSTLQRLTDSLPTLTTIQELESLEARLTPFRQKGLKDILRTLVTRSANETTLVVEQALAELKDFLYRNESFVRDITTDEIPDSVIADTIRTLIDICVKHGNSQTHIAIVASECLGIIGAVDSNRVEQVRQLDELLILHNFEKTEESVRFAHFLLEQRLVKAFLSTTDTRAQGFLSFAMQELLKFCDFSPDVLGRQTLESSGSTCQTRWTDFSVAARNVLSPYLSSKYVLSTVASITKTRYPILESSKTYRDWLTEFLLDLLPKAEGLHTRSLFSDICSKIIKGQDLSILNFILPHIVLHIIISGKPQDRDNISTELLSILRHEVTLGNHAEAEMLKRCSEVRISQTIGSIDSFRLQTDRASSS